MSANSHKYSDLKIVWFSEKLKSMRDHTITPPIYVRFKPTNMCNHHCWWCVYHEPQMSRMHEDMVVRDTIPTTKWSEILDDFAEIGVRAVTYTGGGEPFLHKDFVPMAHKTLDLGIDLSVITNGQLLCGDHAKVVKHAKWIRVSMDYNTAEQFEKNRRVSARGFKQIMDNLWAFADIKDPTCDFGVNYIVHKDNCDGLADIAFLLKEYGVENVRFSPMWTQGFREYHLPIKAKVEAQLQEAAKMMDGKFTVNTTYNLDFCGFSLERQYSRCHFGQCVPVVGADQNVYACHNKAYDHTGLIGSIKDKRFKELWLSGETQAFFDRLNPCRDCCHQCANDTKNLLIEKMINSAGDNFV